MDDTSPLFPALASSSLEPAMAALDRIYRSIDEAQASWIAATPYRCPSGCGLCCEGFEPDLSEAEAYYLAAWLLRENADAQALEAVADAEPDRIGCVLARAEGEYHCTVYGGRPLICRLFAFSGDRDKDGAPRFRPCVHMPAEEPRQLGEAALRERYGMVPPLMGDFASEVETLLPGSAGSREPLRAALPGALRKLRYMAELSARARAE